LKSAFSTPWPSSHWPAGVLSLNEPAGEMWSVVMLSPNRPMMRAPCTPDTSALGCIVKSAKKGGSAM